jgi:hypothetical protein
MLMAGEAAVGIFPSETGYPASNVVLVITPGNAMDTT